MIHAHIFNNKREATYHMSDFFWDNREDIKCVTGYRCLVEMNNGDEHYFISDYEYPTWCKGRAYMLNGVPYHSGYQIALPDVDSMERMNDKRTD